MGCQGMNSGAVAVLPLKRKMHRTAPTLGERAKKIPTDKSRDFYEWWSWGELNPRPRDLFVWFYVRSRLIWISLLESRSNTLPKTPVT
jgi:hypothetical protein